MITVKFEGVAVEKISRNIVEQIKKRLINGSLQPGEVLPSEENLSKIFGVSRSSIREALQILEIQGVVDRKKRSGTVIRKLSILDMANIYLPRTDKESLLDLMETREILEVAIVELVAERANSKDFHELENLMKWMADNPAEAAEADVAFHLTLARMSRNEVLFNIVKSLKGTMDRLQEKTIYLPGRLEYVLVEHRKIVESIKSNDAGLAKIYMKRHLRKVKDLLEEL